MRTLRNICLGFLYTFLISAPIIVKAQTADEKPSIKISGYVITEAYYDSYMSLDSRDGEIYFYPLRKKLDIDGNDKNKVGQFEMLGLQSRLRVGVNGGVAFGAKLSGLLEADFLGTASDYKFMFRLRHAIIKMDWEKTQVLMGQYWHPAVIPELSPNTLLFAAVAFNPLNRPTQVRVTHQLSPNVKIMGAISTFSAHRPSEPAGNNSQRNAGIPETNLQIQLGNTSSLFASLTGGYKFLKPYLTTPINTNSDSSFAATKVVGSYAISGTVGYSMSLIAVKMQCTYGENLTHFNMIGGYAPVKGSRNAKGEYDYTNMKTLTFWGDLETKGSKVKFGLFAGYTENLGTNDSVEFINALGINTKKDLCRNDADLKSVYRISPRVYFFQGPVTLGIEYILTGANYGTFSGKKIIDVVDKSINHRFMIAMKYSF